MSMNLRYSGGFYSYDNVLYDVKIYQEGFSGSATAIAFSDEPLDITWDETAKHDPVQSSSAKLRLFSDTDRQFIDLYTADVCSVRMDVFRAGVLYWSGTLDTELYEEPFAYRDNYEVDLTFSDFAVLERKNYDLTGFKTLQDLITTALGLVAVNCTGITTYISTNVSGGSTSTFLTDISLISDNFYDEDGEPMSWKDVMEAILQPFALRIIQKSGQIFVYDINAVYTAFNGASNVVNWASDDSSISFDKVYNNIKITFSPYHHTTILESEVDPDDVGADASMLVKLDCATDTTVNGFTISTSTTGKGLTLGNGLFFKIAPEYSGSEEAGVAWTVKQRASDGTYTRAISTKEPAHTTSGTLFTAANLGYVGQVADSINWRLRLTLSLLADVRYNPFESESIDNEEGDYDEMKNRCNFVYAPIQLTLKDASGNALYHYVNSNIFHPDSSFATGIVAATGWVAGAASWGDAYLAWYDYSDRKAGCGIGGWQTNKRCIGYIRKALPQIYEKADAGEYIMLPPVGGWLELQVGDGFYSYDYGPAYSDIYDELRWLLYKDPKIELAKSTGLDADDDDIVHSGYLLKSAKEELTIDTTVGSSDTPSPTALGQIFNADGTSVITKITRNGVTDIPEKLLIGTIYSAYAVRHHILSGTVDILSSFACYGDTNQSGLYLISSETQYLRRDESEIKMIEIDPDNYQASES